MAKPLLSCWFINLALCCLLTQSFTCIAATKTITDGKLSIISFEHSSPLASKQEIAKRLLHVGIKAELQLSSKGGASKLVGYSIAPKMEQWSIYRPNFPTTPHSQKDQAIEDKSIQLKPRAYGLVVWIDAREKPRIPADWISLLEENNLILVAAHNSGNSQSDLDRRIPLALNAVYNLKKQYRIDKNRVYIAGLSGGARVASHMAIAYGDIFSGGYFIAGNDAISSANIPVPNASILTNIQNKNRYVFLSGKYDTLVYAKTKKTIRSFKKFCILNILQQKPTMGHGMPKAGFFTRAIKYLDSPNTKIRQTKDCQQTMSEQITIAKTKLNDLSNDANGQKTHKIMVELQQQFGNLVEEEFNRAYQQLYH